MAPYRHEFAKRAAIRYERRLNAAFVAHENETPLRQAADIARLSLSGFYHNYFRRDIDRKYSRLTLTYEEEMEIIVLLKVHSDNGRYLSMDDIQTAVEMMVRNFPEIRRRNVPFTHGRPACKFCSNFAKIHRDSITFRKPRVHKAKRYRATNAVNLATHFAQLERLISHYRIDAAGIINIDDSGITANK